MSKASSGLLLLTMVLLPGIGCGGGGGSDPAPGACPCGVYDEDYVWLTNAQGQYVDQSGCVLVLTVADSSGDPDFEVWECLQNNPSPGVDQRVVLTDTQGNPITELRCTCPE